MCDAAGAKGRLGSGARALFLYHLAHGRDSTLPRPTSRFRTIIKSDSCSRYFGSIAQPFSSEAGCGYTILYTRQPLSPDLLIGNLETVDNLGIELVPKNGLR